MSEPHDMSSSAHGIAADNRPTRRAPAGRLLVARITLAFIAAFVLVWTGGSLTAGGVFGCDSCHAMNPYATAHSDGPHVATGCRECHTGTGFAAAAAAGPRGLRWVSSALFRGGPGPIQASDRPCRSCHASVLTETVESRGLRVRHSDFSEMSCQMCHSGSSHALSGRYYLGPQMEDCTACHSTSATRVSTCETCHVGDENRAAGASAWRAGHGEGWEQAHGMGDLGTCVDCHAPSYCAGCHGLAIPHPVDWATVHGSSASQDRTSCDACHDPDWCGSCHGVEMPHPVGFIAVHPARVKSDGPTACYRCHALTLCESCHVKSSHPPVPGVRSDAHGGER